MPVGQRVMKIRAMLRQKPRHVVDQFGVVYVQPAGQAVAHLLCDVANYKKAGHVSILSLLGYRNESFAYRHSPPVGFSGRLSDHAKRVSAR